MCDFELAFIGAFRSMFESSRIKCCHFHFGQNIYRHVQMLGLQNLYTNDLQFNSAIKILIG